jgi:hypothetical protein
MNLIFSIFFAVTSWAAIPPQEPITLETLKFSLSDKGTGWSQTPPPPDAASVKLLFRGPQRTDNSQPTLTVRVEKLDKTEKELKDYFKRWLKEYPKFGYSVLGHKTFVLDGRPAYVVDLTSTSSGKQARQILTEKDREVVLLTCLDDQGEFMKSLPACNSLIKSFGWKKL